MFTARNRQNPFAKRRREQAEAEQQAAEQGVPVAVPVDLNPDSAEYTQAPDISTYATGGVVEHDDTAHLMSSSANAERLHEAVADMAAGRNLVEPTAEELSAVIEISADTQAKIDAVMSHTIPPVADERPDYPGPRGAEIVHEPVYAEIVTTGEPFGTTAGLHLDKVPVIAPEQIDEPKRGRGRPRPQETIERDNAVHALLVGADPEIGISKESIAAELDEKEQQVYSSLRQLTKEGRAENRYVKPHGYRWFAV